jgi:hypothetical protein
MLSLAWNSLVRRRGTTVVTLAVTAVATGFLVLLVVLIQAARGYLAGTLLGTYIMVHIEGYHLAMAGIALAVAVIAATDSGLLGVLQRRQELALLLAMGWEPRRVGQLIMIEGFLLGIAGSLLGLAVGISSYMALTGGFEGIETWLAPSVLAALVPGVAVPAAFLLVAFQAKRVALAPALRSE